MLKREGKPIRVLVVDDEAEILELLEFQFNMVGCETVTAGSGNQGSQLLGERGPFDVVLTDIRMADGDGLALLAKVKALSNGPAVVLMSGYSDVTEEQAIKRGAMALVSKPMNSRELIDLIVKIGRERRA